MMDYQTLRATEHALPERREARAPDYPGPAQRGFFFEALMPHAR